VILAGSVLVGIALASLVLGVLGVSPGGVDALAFVYGAIGASLAAAVLIGAGVVRNRPRHSGVTSGEGVWSGASEPRAGADEPRERG
jgi:hypothetical protein